MGFVTLYAWAVVVVVLFRKLPLQKALIWSIVGGYLFLPSEHFVFYDLPLLPSINKLFIPSVAALVMCLIMMRQHANPSPGQLAGRHVLPALGTVNPGWLPRSKVGRVLTIAFIVGAVMSVLTNGDPIYYPGNLVMPAQRPYDIFSNMLYWGVLFLPMLLGRKFLSDPEGHKLLLWVLCMGGLIYTVPMLYEMRMSPQINNMLYGFFPNGWTQHWRAGGWRPIVFLNHGLLVGIYMAMAVIAAATLTRVSTGGAKLGYAALTIWLLIVLVLSRNLGALTLAIVLTPLVLFTPVRIQLMFAAIVAALVMLYPMLRGADLVPVDQVVAFFEGVDPDRAGSLEFRFHHEKLILDHANERPFFGWSGWSRWRVIDEETGRDLTVADGFWVITISESGWVGYIARFGLFCLPIILFFLRRKKMGVDAITAGLALAVLANLFDLLPNDSSTPVLFLAVGALLGRLELQSDTATEATAERAPAAARRQRQMSRPRPTSAEPDIDPGPPDLVPEPSLPGSRYTRFPATKRREI